MEDIPWLELVHLFTSVKDLYLSKNSVSFVTPVLQELSGERVTEVLPMLESLFLEGSQPSKSVKEVIWKFVAA
jgi:hypothetical protein